MFSLTTTDLIGFSVPIFVAVYIYRRAKLPLPPGPPGSLLVGNAKQIPKDEAWKKYQKWGEIYGPVIYLRIITRQYVVLNSAKAVTDLLDKRAEIYSDRPKLWMYQELCNRKLNVFSISSEHPRHKIYRKILNTFLSRRALPDYYDVMRSESLGMLKRLQDNPENFFSHIRRFTAGIIMKLAYGYTVSSDHDVFVEGVEAAFAAAAKAMTPGRWLVDYFPILRFVPSWFPGADFQRQAKVMRAQLDKLTWTPHAWVKDQMATGNYTESITSRMLQPEDGSEPTAEEEDMGIHVVSALYAGAADTTVSALTTFFLVMSLHPEIQRRAQEEIDVKIGRNRLPDFDDHDSLPYLLAIMKEIFRWAPVTPLGLPHAVTKEDEYEGYRIPKGATIVANIWAMMHDENMYPDPFRFSPERFLMTDDNEPQRDPYDFEFGFGRRLCPGMAFAHDSIFLLLARILTTFNIAKAKDKSTGKDIEPEIFYGNGVTSHPKAFQCTITLRPEAAAFLF